MATTSPAANFSGSGKGAGKAAAQVGAQPQAGGWQPAARASVPNTPNAAPGTAKATPASPPAPDFMMHGTISGNVSMVCVKCGDPGAACDMTEIGNHVCHKVCKTNNNRQLEKFKTNAALNRWWLLSFAFAW